MLEPWDKPGWKPVLRGEDKEGQWLENWKICPECKTKIPKKAIRCPNCGGKIGLVYTLQGCGCLLLVLGILGFFGFLLLLLLAF